MEILEEDSYSLIAKKPPCRTTFSKPETQKIRMENSKATINYKYISNTQFLKYLTTFLQALMLTIVGQETSELDGKVIEIITAKLNVEIGKDGLENFLIYLINYLLNYYLFN